MRTKKDFITTEQQAIDNLVKAASYMVKNARWVGLCPSKISQLRVPLIQLKLARRTPK